MYSTKVSGCEFPNPKTGPGRTSETDWKSAKIRLELFY